MAEPPQRGALRTEPDAGTPRHQHRQNAITRALNRAFLRFSNDFMAFRPATLEEKDQINDQILRRVIAIGFFLGSLVMVAAVAFAPDQVGPTGAGWAGAAAFAAFSAACALWRGMPSWLVRGLAFDVTVLALCLVVAIGDAPAYIALLFFGWPALTSAHFGRVSDFIRTGLEVLFLLPIALAFSEIPLPALAYVGVLAVSGLSAIVVRAVVFQATALFAELDHIASTDALTGLLNRRAATVALEEAVARAHRQGTSSPWRSSISTTSSASTTRSATRREMPRCGASRRC